MGLILCHSPLFAQEAPSGGLSYEKGIAYLMSDEDDRAIPFFEKAVQEGGEFADAARLHLIRLRLSKDAQAESIRTLLNEIQDPRMMGGAYLAAVQGYSDRGKFDEAVEFGLEFVANFSQNPYCDDALFMVSWIQYKKGRTFASIRTLKRVLEEYPGGDMTDDARYLLAKIYLEPGEYYHPTLARSIMMEYQENLDKKEYKNSIWKDEIQKLIMENF